MTRSQGLRRERDDVQRAQPGGGDEQDLGRQPGVQDGPGLVGEGAALVVVADEQPARALDQDQVVRGGQFGDGGGHLGGGEEGHPGPPGGGVGRQRLRVADEFTNRQIACQAPDFGRVPGLARRDTGLPGLEHGDLLPAAQRRRGEGCGGDGLADVRVGARHEQDAGAHPATAAAVTASAMRATSSSSVT